MSYFQVRVLGTITAFPVAVPLIPGGMYKTGTIVQGSLTYEAYGQAVTATELSDRVILDTDIGDDAWSGLFNWNTGQLYYVEDKLGNSVAGALNISLFRWHDAGVHSNVLDATSSITWTGFPATSVFRRNRVTNGAAVVFSAVNVTVLNIENNVFEGGVTATFRQAGIGNFSDSRVTSGSVISLRNYNVDNSSFINGASVTWGASNNVGPISILASTIDSSTVSGNQTNGGLALSQMNIQDSSVSITTASFTAGSDLVLTGGLIAAKSAFSISGGVITQDMTFQNFSLLSRGSVAITGGTKAVASNIQDLTVTDNSNFTSTGGGFDSNGVNVSCSGALIVSGSTLTVNRASVISGALTTDSFNIDGALLIGGASTLTADVTDAFKNNFTNVLP